MLWFFIALLSPLMHAAVNHIDKHLIARYLKAGQVGSLVLFSALFAVVALPFIGWFHQETFSVSWSDALLLMFNGGLIVFAYILYFYALERDEASFVVPLFQMVPVIGFILSFLFLGETISPKQLLASLLILCGSLLLSLDLEKRGMILKSSLFWLMFFSSFFYAVNGILFKFVADDRQAFWPSLFWDFAGKVAIGAMIFIAIRSYRNQFLAVLKQNKSAVLAMNGLNEILALIGEGASALAVLLAPVALVQIVGTFQPAFVFLYGLLLTRFVPHFATESTSKRALYQKLAGIAVILSGSILLIIV